MAKDPAFLLYSSDFLTGTMFMNNEEVGIYIRLLCAQHQHGGRINKEDFFRLCLGYENVINKFIKEGDLYYNSRLEIEINKRKRDADASRTNGLKGGRPKGKKPKHNLRVNLNKTQTKPKRNLTENVNEDEIIDYFVSNNYKKEAAKKFFNYYSTSNWIDSNGKPVLNWKQKAQSVWFVPENEVKENKYPKSQIENNTW